MNEQELTDEQIDWLLDHVDAEFGADVLFSDAPQTDFLRAQELFPAG